jgi:hypothetical protein
LHPRVPHAQLFERLGVAVHGWIAPVEQQRDSHGLISNKNVEHDHFTIAVLCGFQRVFPRLSIIHLEGVHRREEQVQIPE